MYTLACVFITAVPNTKLFARGGGTREEPGTLTQGGALFSMVPLAWESNPKLCGASPSEDLTIRGSGRAQRIRDCQKRHK